MSGMRKSGTAKERARKVFQKNGGTLRMSEALRLGLTRWTLYTMRDAGLVQPISRGVYRLTELPPLGNPDLVTVALRIPKGVVCLISALVYHDLTTQVPHEIHVAIERGAETPRVDYPPIRFYRFSGSSFREAIEVHELDNLPVRIYDREKTVADCFKYRNKIGLDVAIEALRLWRKRKGSKVEPLMKMARVCRVESVMRPYVESVL